MTHRRLWFAVAAVVGCGRSGFDQAPDAAPVPQGESNLVFVTSSLQSGALGGLAGADAICAQRAAEAGLAGTFVAWLSTTTTTAFSRLEGSRGWRLVDGTPVADTPTDLVTSALLSPIALDEHGSDVRASGVQAWTGTNADGTYSGLSCQDWTSAVATDLGHVGDPAAGGGLFSIIASSGCDQLRPLYCFGLGHTNPVAVERARGRFAFVTDAAWFPNPGGVDSADALCSGEAKRAGLPGSYRAVLPTPTEAAEARFDLTGLPWMRVDGAVLADTAEGLFADPLRRSFLTLTATGAVVPNARTWAGDPTQATDHCSVWTSPASTVVARGGRSDTTRTTFFNDIDLACNEVTPRLICLQE